MFIKASEIKSEFHADSDGQKLIKLIEDMGWDYDRFSSSGQETYDKLGELLGWDNK